MWECAQSTFFWLSGYKFNLRAQMCIFKFFLSFINQSNIKSKIYGSLDGHYSMCITIFQHSCQIWDRTHFRLWVWNAIVSFFSSIVIFLSHFIFHHKQQISYLDTLLIIIVICHTTVHYRFEEYMKEKLTRKMLETNCVQILILP
jgi:hypothetical protein